MLGIKVTMTKHNPDKGKLGEHLVYGIKEIVLWADT